MPNTTSPNSKAGLVFIQTVYSQNKIDIITTSSNQVNPNDKNSSTASSTAFTQEDSQDALSHMSMDETKIDCDKVSLVPTPTSTPHQSHHSWDTSLASRHVMNDVEQELQEVASVIKKACRILVFVGARISTNCDISVSIGLHF